MRKYLSIGLFILIGTNLVVLSGVVFNRMGEVTAHITLTERELSLPYSNGIDKENSGILLSVNWRTVMRKDEPYFYNSREVKITKGELLELGFDKFEENNNFKQQSRELYWAFEFDGELYAAELEKAVLQYQTAFASYEAKPSDTTKRNKEDYSAKLKREQTTNSRLFFIKASADYKSLAAQLSDKKNILIVKGLTKPYYKSENKSYSLLLKHLSVSNIMVPVAHSEVFIGLHREYKSTPRYTAEIKWGSGLEPWIISTKRIDN